VTDGSGLGNRAPEGDDIHPAILRHPAAGAGAFSSLSRVAVPVGPVTGFLLHGVGIAGIREEPVGLP